MSRSPSRERSNERNVAPAVERREEEAQEPPKEDADCKLFIANLTYVTKTRDLEEIFAKHGTVKEVHVAEDKYTGRSKGFGFVTMATPEDCEEAIKNINGMEVDGREIKVERSTGGPGGRRDRGAGGGRGGGDRGGRGGGDPNVCYDWQRGSCNRGSSCRFNHGDDRGSRGGDRGYDRGGGDRRDYGRDRGGYGGDRDRGHDRDRRDNYGGDRGYDRDRGYGGDRGGDRRDYGGRGGDRDGGDRYRGGGDRDAPRDRSRERY